MGLTQILRRRREIQNKRDGRRIVECLMLKRKDLIHNFVELLAIIIIPISLARQAKLAIVPLLRNLKS